MSSSSGQSPQDNTANQDRLDRNLFVVGVGASAGGLSALEELFANLPTDSGAAFVVIQHLSPDFKSLMKELLERHTEMEVYRVTQGMELKPNSVFLIPPGKNLIVTANVLKLQDRKKIKHEINFPIDLFFTSLAKNYQEKAIGVILSGSGSDGTHGLTSISEAGGIALVQEPNTAEFNGMPLSAVATGVVDRILPVPELARSIHQYIASSLHSEDVEFTEKTSLSYASLKKIASIILASEKIDFSSYRTSTMSRRIHRRRLINNLEDIGSYIELLNSSSEEKKILCSDLLINVTRFFRDRDAWNSIERDILPAIIKRAKPHEELRFWIAGCSTGQEAYSLAILVDEALRDIDVPAMVKIFATDIDRDALETASAGIYPEFISKDISPERLQKYFVKSDNCYQVTRKIREMLIFSAHNLARDAVFTRLHFVSCRNVLIYMQSDLQQRILRNFHFSLRSQGVLFLGEAESVGQLDPEFKTLDKKWKIYQKRRNVKLLIPNHNISKPRNNSLVNSYTPPRAVKTESLIERSFQRLLTSSKSAVLIVSSSNQLLHVYGESELVLQTYHGKIETDVTRMVEEALQLPLNTALHRAKKEHKTIEYTNIKYSKGTDNYHANLTVVPPETNDDDDDFYLVKLNIRAVESSQVIVNEQFEANSEAQRRIFTLENELQHTRENLQTLVEELETTNEEQQASNEELTASNEELQSTNEELHSVNEELHTVNIEYQSKIQELTQLNDDIDNLLHSTDIGVIFLDSEFRIRKFTPAVTSAIALRKTDLDRPLGELYWKFECRNLFGLLNEVLSTRQPAELEVKLKDSESYLLMQVHVYQTESGDSEGLVIGFIKIDEIKQVQKNLEREIEARKRTESQLKINQEALLITQERVENIFSSLEDAVWSFDLPEKKLGYLNTSFEKIYGRDKSEFMENLDLWLEVVHPEDKDMVQEAHRLIKQQEKIDLEYRILHPDGSLRWVRDRTKVISDDFGTAIRQDFVISDLTEQRQAQMALKEREQSFQAIFNSMYQFIGVLDPAGILLEANQTALAFGGLTPEDVLNRPFWEAKWWTISEATQEQLKQAIARAAAGEFVRYEVDVIGAEDRIVTIDFSLKPVTDEIGNVVKLIPEGRDVSELKQAREQLQQTNLDLECRVTERTQSLAQFGDRLQLLHRLATAEYQHLEDLFVDYLQAGCQMLNLATGIVSEVDDCIYKIVAVQSPLGLEVGYEAPCVDTYCAEVVETKTTITFAAVGNIKSMQNHPVYLNLKLESFIGTPILVNGSLYGTLNFSDTTPRELGFTGEEIKIVELMAKDIGNSIATVIAEEALEKSLARFRNTFEQAAVGVAHISPAGKFIKVNLRLCNILGYEDRVLLERTFQEITHPEDLSTDLEYLDRLLTGQIDNCLIEKRYLKSDRSLVWVNVTVSLVKDKLEQPDYFIAVIEDIGDRKKTELALEQSRLQLEQANQAKDSFIAHMSHELRTPLNSVIGFSHILQQDSSLTDNQLKSINIVNQSGQHLLTLINDVLELSKLNADKLEIKYNDLDLAHFLNNIVTIFSIRAQDKGLDFSTHLSENLATLVNIDETKLRQVLFNLLSNAVKFTSAGSINFSVSSFTPTSDRNSQLKTFRFTVEDTGRGIPHDEHETIFAPFGQVEQQNYDIEGTGLGLSICQKILKLMDSELYFVSTVGKGSRFWFDLDLREVSPHLLPQANSTKPVERKLATPCKVLIVDDRTDNRALLVEYLQNAGFTPQEAADGQSGMAIAQEFQPDVVLVDLMMPVMNGREMIKAIRQDDLLKDTIAIVISANIRSIIQPSEIKCDGFIAKPVDLELLLELLEQHLELDWQVLEEQSESADIGSDDLIAPHREKLIDLLELVSCGMISELCEQIDLLTSESSQYIYFAQKINHLANNYDQDKLEDLIKSLIEKQ